MTKLFTILSVLLFAMILRATEVNNHFDSINEIKTFKPREKAPASLFERSTKAAGAGSYKSLKGFSQSFDKEPITKGVLTLWIYDDYFQMIDNWEWHHVNYGLTRIVDGKKKKFKCEIRRYTDGWRTDLNDPSQKLRYFPMPHLQNHGGWTRFDIVMPAGPGPKNLTVFIDGYKAFTTPGKYDSIFYLSTNWIPFVDELSYNSDPSSFRPNPIRKIQPSSPYGLISLKPGEKLRVNFAINQKGARTRFGELSLSLVNGRGETISSNKITVDWSKANKKLEITLPSPPRSGYYWLDARYLEAGKPIDFSRRKINLQFLTLGFAQKSQEPLDLFRTPWDFLPIGETNLTNVGQIKSAIPTKKELAIPATAPTDWTQAYQLQGPWIFTRGYFNLKFSCHAGWYHKKVNIPSEWKGKNIMLEIDCPESIATVFANGKHAGSLEWPGGIIDMTSFAIPGKTLDLAIHISADPVSGYYKLARKYISKDFQVPKNLKRRGLGGDVVLFPEPKGVRFDGAIIRTSFAEKKLTAIFELSGLNPGETYLIKSAATNAGKIAKALPISKFKASSSSAKITLSTHWANPILWELNAPYLYDMNAALCDSKGKILSTLWPERFGFREITNNGPDLILNGRPITLFHSFGAMANLPESSQWCERFGFLSRYYGFGREDARLLDEAGKTRTGDRLHREATLMAPLDVAKSSKKISPMFWKGITDILKYQTKDKRNHPGIFFQSGTLGGGRNGNGGMYNPYFQNGTWINKRTGNEVSMRALKEARRVIDILHKLDPTRLVTVQDSGSVNDTMHITEYAGFLPIQEFIEKTEYWRAYGTKPFLISEQAAPMFPNWTDACSQGKGWRGVPCFAEWSAITRGDKAYIRTEMDEEYLKILEKAVAEKRQKIKDTFKDPLKQDAEIAKIRMTFNPWFYREKEKPQQNIIWKNRMREQIFNWRANNLALIGYWFSGGGPKLELCYPEFNAPVTGFLAGTKDKPTLKNHIFTPDETLKRAAILLNNTHKAESLTCEWKVELAGKIIAQQSETKTIPPGGKVFIPITAKFTKGEDRSGKITVNFIKNGIKLRSDTCPIDVIKPKVYKNKGRIALVDPEGDTAKALENAGVKFQMLCFDEDFTPFDTVIFGRKAFNYEFNLLPDGLDLGTLTLQGKRILIMEQDEKTLRNRFKLRTEYLSPRDVFGRIGNHPILEGLPDRLLKYWRGYATLTDGYAVAREKGNPKSGGFGNGGTWRYLWNDDSYHNRPMKWGNTHNVATVTVIKPDTGNFRTLIDSGYNNNYAAAWELENANSRIVFNQIDVSGRSESDPAAQRYLQNLIRYVQDSPNTKLCQAAYLGGDKGADLLKSIDVPFKKVKKPTDAIPGEEILFVGDLTTDELKTLKDAIAKFASAGGTVFSLPRSQKDFAAGWTPFLVKTKKKKINHTIVGKPSARLLAGLGNSDFYWKGNMELVSITEAEGADLLLDTGILAEIPYGKGRYILCQVEPALFGDVKLDHWLKPSKRNTERMLRTLISNVGVALPEPQLLALPKAKEELDRIISLSGGWKVCPANIDAVTCPSKDDKIWRGINLPGAPQKSYSDWKGIKGAFWYRRTLNLDKKFSENETLRMIIGRVSGSDLLVINGEKVAFTNSETNVNSVATISRDYKIPATLFKKGENEIVLFVTYDTNAALGMKGSTGEIAAPLELKIYKTKIEGKIPDAINLASRYEWWGQKAKDVSVKWNHKIRKRLAVPAYIQTQRSEWSDMTGYFWYWREFKLKEPLPEGVRPLLIMGAVDDEDTTYFNEVKIGHTGKDTNPDNYWMAPRAYPIPRELFKVGNNIIKVQVNDFNVSGGICKGPVKIIFEDPEETRKRKLVERPYLHSVNRQDDPYWHHGF